MNAYHPRHLDIPAFAGAGAVLERDDAQAGFERLLAETDGRCADRAVHWHAKGEREEDASGHARHWLHLRAETVLSLTCQRCLEPVDMPLAVERSFRFVATEAQAEIEDEESEEDVLAISREFDLLALVEDELLMELPLAPTHESCPSRPSFSVADADFKEPALDKPNPFAALAGLRTGKGGAG
ncbi:YceD family protein [Hylemonella sp. W303a]|uniref:YceD family protein n=1 Tax=Hylemonella sp. W303a TaxID=3389873 RepID=UPI00396B1F56